MKESVKSILKTLTVVVMSIALSIAALTWVFGDATATGLAIQRAQLCTLVLPTDPIRGRDEGRFNRVCMVQNDLEPFDVNGDGKIEVDP